MIKRTLTRWLLVVTGLTVGAAGVFSDVKPEELALGTPGPVVFPKENPYTKEKADLGKKLFNEVKMSSSTMTPCSWCHFNGLGYTDGKVVGLGAPRIPLSRNTPSLYNIGYNENLFWDGRTHNLEEQALFPIKHPMEMAMKLEDLPHKLEMEHYAEEFEKAYGTKEITLDRVAKALATFERTITENNTPFDRYMKSEKNAMSKDAMEGLRIFQTKGQCITCHAGPQFTTAMIKGGAAYKNTGVKKSPNMSEDDGRLAVDKSDPELKGAFRIPTLRGVGKTAPYMHNGSLPTLEAVVEFYDRGGDEGRLPKLNLTVQEKAQLVDFLLHGITDWNNRY